MQRREYFHWAHRYLKHRVKIRSVQVKCHNVETSLLEGLRKSRRPPAGRRRRTCLAAARLDSWGEHLKPDLWWQAVTDCGLNCDGIVHRASKLATACRGIIST